MCKLFFLIFFTNQLVFAGAFAPSDFEKSLVFLKSCQKQDGGFGEKNSISNSTVTLTSIMGILNYGEDPQLWLVQGKNPFTYLKGLNDNLITLAVLSMKIIVYDYFKNIFSAELANAEKTILSRTQSLLATDNKYYVDEIWILRANARRNFLPADLQNRIVARILQFQNTDGGFKFDKNSVSEANMTALAVMALKESRYPAATQVKKALSFLKSSKNIISWIPSKKSDSITTSQLLQMAAFFQTQDFDARDISDQLISFLNKDGSMKWTQDSVLNPCYTTAFALLALKPAHIIKKNRRFSAAKKINSQLKMIKVNVRLAYQNKTFFDESAQLSVEKSRIKSKHGSYVESPDVFSISKNIFEKKNIKFKAFDTYGDSFESIMDIQGALPPQRSWHYKVNNRTTDICSVAYPVEEGNEILWYFGNYAEKVLGLQFYKTKDPQKIRVQSVAFNDFTQTWEPESNVSLHLNDSVLMTDYQGMTEISLKEIKQPLTATKKNMIVSRSYRKKDVLKLLIKDDLHKLN